MTGHEATQQCRDAESRIESDETSVAALADLQALTRDEFDLSFALPAPDEIVVAYPSYDRARAHVATLRALCLGRSSVPELLAMAGDASRLDEGTKNPWFRLAEGLAFQDARQEIEERIGESADAPRARRETLGGSFLEFVAK